MMVIVFGGECGMTLLAVKMPIMMTTMIADSIGQVDCILQNGSCIVSTVIAPVGQIRFILDVIPGGIYAIAWCMPLIGSIQFIQSLKVFGIGPITA